ncbi:MAG: FAD-dependent oxidoreductase [Chitinophagaceae bacterium]
MPKFIQSLFFLLCIVCFISLHAQTNTTVDICVYGGTSGGVMAAYTAKKMGKSVLLIEPGKHVGGLTTGGLGYTDIGNKYAITGLSRDFYRRVGKHYGKFEQWIFEPHVAAQTYDGYIKSAGLNIQYQYRLVSVAKSADGYISSIVVESATNPGAASYQTINAKMFIDCSYEGDLMAKAGVSYFTGREANSLYNETYNGVQLREKHQFPDGIDPYKTPGNPASGLVWGVTDGALDAQGTGDKKIQTYNIRLCLSNEPANRIEITKPDNYDPSRYELLIRFLEKKPAKDLNGFLKVDLMPGNKTDINNNGPFSTDMIGMNYDYPEADYDTRDKIKKAHDEYIKGLLYFIGHDERMPKYLRDQMLAWGYPKDEYADNGNWSPQMYVREVRRMKGAYVMTQANCEAKEVVDDGIGMAAYTMDSHNCQRLVVNGMVKNEGDVQIGGFGPYPIAYRSLTPKAEECKNLLVPVCLSATHIAYGSIRMEPVFMVLSQSAAVAALMAIDAKTDVQHVDVKKLQQTLLNNPLADNSTVEVLVDNDDKKQVTVSGSWGVEKKGSYGPSMFTDDGKDGQLKTVRFTPAIAKKGDYNVYAYFPKMQGFSAHIPIVFFNGKTSTDIKVKESDIKVEGQTSGEWVLLGKFNFDKGSKSYVEISNKGANGIVVADALLFVPAFTK